MPSVEAYNEAYKRGLLHGSQLAGYEELKRRGLTGEPTSTITGKPFPSQEERFGAANVIGQAGQSVLGRLKERTISPQRPEGLWIDPKHERVSGRVQERLYMEPKYNWQMGEVDPPGGKLAKIGIKDLGIDSIIMKSFSKNYGTKGALINLMRKNIGMKKWDGMTDAERVSEARGFIKEGIKEIPSDMERLGLTDVDDLLKIRASDPLDPANEFYSELLRRRGFKVTGDNWHRKIKAEPVGQIREESQFGLFPVKHHKPVSGGPTPQGIKTVPGKLGKYQDETPHVVGSRADVHTPLADEIAFDMGAVKTDVVEGHRTPHAAYFKTRKDAEAYKQQIGTSADFISSETRSRILTNDELYKIAGVKKP